MKRLLLIAAFVLPALSVPALAQDFSPESIMAQADKDGDKAISKAEWAGWGVPYPFPDQGDTNMDGKIDMAELTVLIAQFQNGGGPPPPPPAAAPAQAPATPSQPAAQ